jgi:3',5'-cyclic-AMP phosphodiesterase
MHEFGGDAVDCRPMANREPLRVLHITDLHILPEPGSEIYGGDTFESLRLVLGAALALARRPEVIVATGDLSEDGSDASYARLRQLLLTTGLPTYVLPGNHDSVARMRDSLVGGPIGMGPVVELGAWRGVLLDSHVDGQPHGFLEDPQLQLLGEALDEQPDRPVLIGLHHGVVPPCPSDGCRLHNADAVLELLRGRANARVMISGHAHLELERRIDGAIVFTTPSTCSQGVHAQLGEAVDHQDFWASHRFEPDRHGFRVLDLLPDGAIVSEVHWVRRPAAVA